jgi:hypothetical protein
MSEHTKGRLRLDDDGIVNTEAGSRLRLPGVALVGGGEEATENARRLVALRNACNGIPTPVIEGGDLSELFSLCKSLADTPEALGTAAEIHRWQDKMHAVFVASRKVFGQPAASPAPGPDAGA